MKTSINWGGTRTNGRMNFHRANGQFAPKPSLGAQVCPCCNAILLPEVRPVHVNGFVDPKSMRPVWPDVCHRCGHDKTMTPQRAMNQLMAEVL